MILYHFLVYACLDFDVPLWWRAGNSARLTSYLFTICHPGSTVLEILHTIPQFFSLCLIVLSLEIPPASQLHKTFLSQQFPLFDNSIGLINPRTLNYFKCLLQERLRWVIIRQSVQGYFCTKHLNTEIIGILSCFLRWLCISTSFSEDKWFFILLDIFSNFFFCLFKFERHS